MLLSQSHPLSIGENRRRDFPSVLLIYVIDSNQGHAILNLSSHSVRSIKSRDQLIPRLSHRSAGSAMSGAKAIKYIIINSYEWRFSGSGNMATAKMGWVCHSVLNHTTNSGSSCPIILP